MIPVQIATTKSVVAGNLRLTANMRHAIVASTICSGFGGGYS